MLKMNEKMNEGLSQPPGEAGRGAGLGSCVQPPWVLEVKAAHFCFPST